MAASPGENYRPVGTDGIQQPAVRCKTQLILIPAPTCYPLTGADPSIVSQSLDELLAAAAIIQFQALEGYSQIEKMQMGINESRGN